MKYFHIWKSLFSEIKRCQGALPVKLHCDDNIPNTFTFMEAFPEGISGWGRVFWRVFKHLLKHLLYSVIGFFLFLCLDFRYTTEMSEAQAYIGRIEELRITVCPQFHLAPYELFRHAKCLHPTVLEVLFREALSQFSLWSRTNIRPR